MFFSGHLPEKQKAIKYVLSFMLVKLLAKARTNILFSLQKCLSANSTVLDGGQNLSDEFTTNTKPLPDKISYTYPLDFELKHGPVSPPLGSFWDFCILS